MKRSLTGLALVAALAVPMQTQAQITGTYTASGSTGAWLLNFTFQNNRTEGGVYYGFSFTALDATGAPTGWTQMPPTVPMYCEGDTWGIANFCSTGNVYAYGIADGASLGGFTATYTGAALPTSGDFAGTGFWHVGGEGLLSDWEQTTFSASNVSVPEPSTYLLMLTGILGMGFVAWRRREQFA